ncbi:MATE family efflux transporter [uncultured Megasphaera sp.]|uniref:MATE family efflux transporter n=1 Tax=uncultured Megasphaera sp. TaxID=165188 RepID=UPI002659E913|nr:MATE family efflux transporter [uncultured Megasphaera sp.]
MRFPQLYQLTHFLVLFFPLLLSQMAQIATSVFSSMFSGQYSTADLAGVAVAVNLWIPLFSGICGLFFGVSPIISQLRGAGKSSRIPMYIMQSLYIAVFFTVFIVAAGFLVVPPLLDIMDLEPAVHYVAQEYLIALALGVLPIFLQSTMRYIVDAHGMTHISMAIMGTNMVLTIVLFRLLIFGGFGIPPMGGVGTGYAITISYWITCLLFAAVLQWKKPFHSYHLWTKLRPLNWTHCYHQLQLGVPIFIAVFCEMSLFSIVVLLMAEFGTVYLAANQAAISYVALTYTVPWSISLAATIVIGYEVGAKNFVAARQYAVLCQLTAIVSAVFIILITFFFIDPISALFTNEEETFRTIRLFLVYAMIFSLFDSLGTPVQGVLRGYKDIKIITYVAFVMYWLISIPLGYALSHMTSYGPYGYWISIVICLALNALALNWRLWHYTAYVGDRKKMSTE